jgi:hypothetical protein
LGDHIDIPWFFVQDAMDQSQNRKQGHLDGDKFSAVMSSGKHDSRFLFIIPGVIRIKMLATIDNNHSNRSVLPSGTNRVDFDDLREFFSHLVNHDLDVVI